MEAYGFVYLWFDRKHRRWYLGSHWGAEDDGYVCSSRWMRNAYRRRSLDFRRKILWRGCAGRLETLTEEYRWLQMIKPEELGARYYNLQRHHFGHWSTDEDKRLTVGEKIAASHKSYEERTGLPWGHWSKGKLKTGESKEKNRAAALKQFEDSEQRKTIAEKSKELWQDPEYRRINTENKKGRKQLREQVEKRAATKRKRFGDVVPGGFPKGNVPWNKGLKKL